MAISKIKGRKIETWDKSFRIFNRAGQKHYSTGVLFIGCTPETPLIEELCKALDSAHEAGKDSAKKELRAWLELPIARDKD